MPLYALSYVQFAFAFEPELDVAVATSSSLKNTFSKCSIGPSHSVSTICRFALFVPSELRCVRCPAIRLLPYTTGIVTELPLLVTRTPEIPRCCFACFRFKALVANATVPTTIIAPNIAPPPKMAPTAVATATALAIIVGILFSYILRNTYQTLLYVSYVYL